MHKVSDQAQVPPSQFLILSHGLAQLWGDPLRHCSRGPGSDSDALDMGDLGQSAQDSFYHGIIHHQRIAACEQNIHHPLVLREPLQSSIDLLPGSQCRGHEG